MVSDIINKQIKNQYSIKYLKYCRYGTIIFIITGIILSFFYSSLIPFFVSLIIASIDAIATYYQQIYRVPLYVNINNEGLILIYGHDRNKRIPWQNLQAIWVSPNPESTSVQAAIKIFNKRFTIDISKEIADEIFIIYRNIFCKSLDRWDIGRGRVIRNQ